MRDIPTIQGLRSRSVPATRKQAITELVRLEHEAARLQREIEMWRTNQEKTEGRLRQIEKRIDFLNQMTERASRLVAATSRRQHSHGRRGQSQAWEEVEIEY